MGLIGIFSTGTMVSTDVPLMGGSLLLPWSLLDTISTGAGPSGFIGFRTLIGVGL